MVDENPLYDPEILKNHDLGERYTALLGDETLYVRPLYASDYQRGFLELLKELTEVGNVSQQQFQGISVYYSPFPQIEIKFHVIEQFDYMKSCPGTYYCTVIVDTIRDRIVGAATLLMEKKFIRGCASVCHVKYTRNWMIFKRIFPLFTEGTFRRCGSELQLSWEATWEMVS